MISSINILFLFIITMNEEPLILTEPIVLVEPIVSVEPVINQPVDKSTSYFETKTHFDAFFDDVYKEYPKSKRENVSPVFAVITGYEFFKNHLLSKNKHEENIYRSVMFTAVMSSVGKFTGTVSFEYLLTLTNLNKSSICYTTTEIVTREDPELKYVIPDLKKDFCVMFHKKRQYAVVIGDSKTNMYHVRDCIEPFQFDFKDKAKLIAHLKDMYIISSGIAVKDDNTVVAENAVIEYIVVDDVFEHSLDVMMETILLDNNNHQDVPGAVVQANETKQNNGLILGYVKTDDIPDDGVDIMELQRKFGDQIDENNLNNYQYGDQHNGIDYGPKWTAPKHNNYYDSADDSDDYAEYDSNDEDSEDGHVKAKYVSDGEEYFLDSP